MKQLRFDVEGLPMTLPRRCFSFGLSGFGRLSGLGPQISVIAPTP
jgi:hypothetical protein